MRQLAMIVGLLLAASANAAEIRNHSGALMSVDVKNGGEFYPYSIASGEEVNIPGALTVRWAGQAIILDENDVFSINQNGFYTVEPASHIHQE